MSLFSRFVKREPTIGRSSLTKSDLERLVDLNNDYRTDYTYVLSKSYRPDGSIKYENPRMFRLPMDYYKRKWAFEEAWKRGYIYYFFYCIADFIRGFVSDPFYSLKWIGKATFYYLVQIFWSIVYFVSPRRSSEEVVARRRSHTTEAIDTSDDPLQQRRSSTRRRSFAREQRYSWSLAEDDASFNAYGDFLRSPPSRSPSHSPSSSPRAARGPTGRSTLVAPHHASRSPLQFISNQVGSVARTFLFIATLGFFPTDYWRGTESMSERRAIGPEEEEEEDVARYGNEDSEPESSRLMGSPSGSERPRQRVGPPMFAKLIKADAGEVRAVRAGEGGVTSSAPGSSSSSGSWLAWPSSVVSTACMCIRYCAWATARMLGGVSTVLFAPIHASSSLVRAVLSAAFQQSDREPTSSRRSFVAAELRRETNRFGHFLRTIFEMMIAFVGGFFSLFTVLAVFPLRVAEFVQSKAIVLFNSLFGGSSPAASVPTTRATGVTRVRTAGLGSPRPSEARGPAARIRRLLPSRRRLKMCPLWCLWLLPIILGVLIAFLLRRHVDCEAGFTDERSNVEHIYCEGQKVIHSAYERASDSVSNVKLPASLSSHQLWLSLRNIWEKITGSVLDIIFAISAQCVTIFEQLGSLVDYLWKTLVRLAEVLFDAAGDLLHRLMVLPIYVFKSTRKEAVEEPTTRVDDSWLESPKYGRGYYREVESRLDQLRKEKDLLANQLTILKREREMDEVRFNELKRAVELAHVNLPQKGDQEM